VTALQKQGKPSGISTPATRCAPRSFVPHSLRCLRRRGSPIFLRPFIPPGPHSFAKRAAESTGYIQQRIHILQRLCHFFLGEVDYRSTNEKTASATAPQPHLEPPQPTAVLTQSLPMVGASLRSSSLAQFVRAPTTPVRAGSDCVHARAGTSGYPSDAYRVSSREDEPPDAPPDQQSDDEDCVELPVARGGHRRVVNARARIVSMLPTPISGGVTGARLPGQARSAVELADPVAERLTGMPECPKP
jgi:hypothetical protein